LALGWPAGRASSENVRPKSQVPRNQRADQAPPWPLRPGPSQVLPEQTVRARPVCPERPRRHPLDGRSHRSTTPGRRTDYIPLRGRRPGHRPPPASGSPGGPSRSVRLTLRPARTSSTVSGPQTIGPNPFSIPLTAPVPVRHRAPTRPPEYLSLPVRQEPRPYRRRLRPDEGTGGPACPYRALRPWSRNHPTLSTIRSGPQMGVRQPGGPRRVFFSSPRPGDDRTRDALRGRVVRSGPGLPEH